MDDYLLLRFRDMLQDTIKQHNDIAEKNTKRPRVLWGWWKKESEEIPSSSLFDLYEDLENNKIPSFDIYFINSGTHEFYKSKLYRIHLKENLEQFLPGEANELCPAYYNNNPLYVWFEIGKLEKISSNELENFVFSTRNFTYSGSRKVSSTIAKERLGQPIDTTDFTFLEDNISFWFICKKENLRPISIKQFPGIFNKAYLAQGKYILHLSDLHFGDQHTYAIPKAKGGDVGKQTLIDSICRDLKVQNIRTTDVALVILSGDITCRASAHEFDEAVRFIDEVKHRFGLSSGQVMCIPGNHDIEWINEDGILNENAELNYRNFYRRVYNCDAEDSLIRINEFMINGHKLAIFGFNSCRLESKETAGIGYVGTEQLLLMEDFIGVNSDANYKIAVLHHHLLPVNYTEAYSTRQKNVSLLLDAEALIQRLIVNGVQTVLHGHQHQPYYSKIHRIIPFGVAGHEHGIDGYLNVIGGGSAGVNQANLNTIGRNTYQLLELNQREDGCLFLHVKLRVRNSDGAGYITGMEKDFL